MDARPALEQAFRAGYYCRQTVGDPEGAYAAWLATADLSACERARIIALIYEELSHEYMPLVDRLVEKIRELP